MKLVEDVQHADIAPSSFRLPGLLRFLDSDYFPQGADYVGSLPVKSRLSRWFPFIFLHVGTLLVFFVGVSPVAVVVAVALYWVRMFAITAFYHRYFSHRTFKTSRLLQFLFAILGNSSVQRGPLWWAAHHRRHHRLSDKPGDSHSPYIDGFIWSHIGWITADCNMPTDYSQIPDLVRFPELVLLNRFDWLVPTFMGFSLYVLGARLESYPQLHTSGLQLLVWGFFVSTVVLFHCTAAINSLTHLWGSQRYATGDESRNNVLLALLTMGEGWHNNHHRFQGTVRQGFYWWEIDVSYYILKFMSILGLVWDLRPVPLEAYADHSDDRSRERRGETCRK
jgi:stearoyl-CoA desaturase (delta-9 desaturase)